MTLAEFYAFMAGAAMRNGAKLDEDPVSDEEFFDDLAAATVKGQA